MRFISLIQRRYGATGGMADEPAGRPAEDKKVRGVTEKMQLFIFYYSLFLLFIFLLKKIRKL